MGSSSKSSSQATSNEVADSYNTITTTSITPSVTGNNSVAAGFGNNANLSGAKLSYASDSNNTTDSGNYSANYGANGSAGNSSGSNGTDPTASGFDWSEVLIWVVGGVALMFVLRALGDKNA